ncbi:hypothetical protein [Desulfogranum marinum]|uniref:hypothetical protein n=1 Tax=Desulfogranum marinum TaxID=453220 RepID=UPI001965F6FF|nr:hypothetical protein [Desulfogranum marinum]MBM9514503.1 hypothetical protein [Desulfogranum marinum]
MRKKPRSVEIFNLSFLDVVSCGFGALILLLVISKISEPQVAQTMARDRHAELAALENELTAVREEAKQVWQQLLQHQEELEQADRQLTENVAGLVRMQERIAGHSKSSEAVAIAEQKLQTARQQLTEEMQRLQRQQRIRTVSQQPIGGIPVDSEYIIFVIDTSGSMQKFAWPMVRRKMTEILDVHPRVKGLQVMNDMGEYMFSQYSGRWIADTPARRKAVLRRLASWAPFSNSSPVEGITSAIRRFYSKEKKISLYVFGDDFSRGSIQTVVNTVTQMNQRDMSGNKRVRIHAIGFPVLFAPSGAENNVIRFAALMRRLAEDNNGSFVGLTNLDK